MMTTDTIELVLPEEKHREAVMAYKDEFRNENETVHGGGGLEQSATFKEWLDHARKSRNPETVANGRVPATVLLAYRKNDNKLVGIIDLRHELNDYLLAHGGHIGYSVRKSERRKGYATQMLIKALNFYKKLEIKKILVTCDKDNAGSAKVIVACGGQLENEILGDDGAIMQRYWISL